MIVLDASAVVWILLDPGPATEPVRERVESPGETVHVPHLLDVEVLSVLHLQTLSDILAKDQGAMALRDLESIKVTRYPHAPLLRRIWELRENVIPPTTRPTSRSPRRSTHPWSRGTHDWRKLRAIAPR